MSLFHSLEEHAEHILATLKTQANHAMQSFGAAHPDLLKIIDVLEDHVEQVATVAAPVVEEVKAKAAPIVAEITEEVTKA
jgi:hypothetical protein